ncbi:MAG: MFS transporter [Chloroflexota bacterium]
MLVIATFVVVLGSGTRAAPGALLLGIEQDTGWSASEVALAGAAGLLLLGLGGPVSGMLINRFGVRRVTVFALLLTAAGMGGSAFSRELWQLVLLFGLVSGFGAGLVASSLGPVVANRWFVRGRGLIVGIFGASSSAGQLVFFPALTALSVVAGWRAAASFMALLLLLVAIPAAVFLRERPADVGELPRGGTEDDARQVALTSDPGIMRRAVRSPMFWLLAGTFFVCGASSNGVIGQHFIAHAVDHGFTPVAASGALALMGLFNFVGTLASGWLTDRVDPRRLLMVFYVFRGISLLFLPVLTTDSGIPMFAVMFGLDYIATVPPTVMLVADTFGRRNVGIVYGWVYFSHMLGAAIAAEAAGLIRDDLGSYAVAFVAAGWLAVAAGVATLVMRRPKLATQRAVTA